MTKATKKRETLLEQALKVNQQAKGNTLVTQEEIELALAALSGKVGQKQVTRTVWPGKGTNPGRFYRFMWVRLIEAHHQGKLVIND